MKAVNDIQPPPNPTGPIAGVAHGCSSVLLVGCHGGAGTTTLTGQLAPLGHETDRETLAGMDLAGQAVIVVARSTAAGTRHAADTITQLLQAGAAPLVAVVADGPWPEPLAARARIRALSGHVPVVRVPYITRWRFEDTPSTVPDRYERAVTRLRAAYCRCTEHPDVRRTA